MEGFVSKLRALIIGTSKTSLKEDTKVNTFRTQHFCLATDVDTFELGVVTVVYTVLYALL